MRAMIRPVRFGVIGLRRGRSFLRICSVVGGATVSAVYDVDFAGAQAVATELGVAAHSDFDNFLAADIDAVVIASPVPAHAGQAVAALKAGKHVLSEVIACTTVADARALVEAARSSDAVYMLAENYRYRDEVELVKRMCDVGRFGEIYYGEGEYLHDCRDLWYDATGALTWRGRGELSVYCTHSIGPLLYITGDRVATVSAVAVPGGKYDRDVTVPTMHLMNMITDAGRALRVRVDHVSARPELMAYYAVQGDQGCYESWRGNGDRGKVWLADVHGASRIDAPAQWRDLDDFADAYIADRLAAPAGAASGGHGTTEYWMLDDFLAAVRGEREPAIDVYRGLDYTLPGICADAVGTPIAVPDPREW